MELVELNESKSKSIKSALDGIFFPVLKFKTKLLLYELE